MQSFGGILQSWCLQGETQVQMPLHPDRDKRHPSAPSGYCSLSHSLTGLGPDVGPGPLSSLYVTPHHHHHCTSLQSLLYPT